MESISGFPKINGYHFGGPHKRDSVGKIYGSPHLLKLRCLFRRGSMLHFALLQQHVTTAVLPWAMPQHDRLCAKLLWGG